MPEELPKAPGHHFDLLAQRDFDEEAIGGAQDEFEIGHEGTGCDSGI